MAGSGFDTAEKTVYKAMTGAYKYFLRQLFCIETGDDPERDELPRESRQQAPQAPKPGARGSIIPPEEIPLYSRGDYEQHIQPAPADTQAASGKPKPTKRDKLVAGYHHHEERIGAVMTDKIVKAHYTGTLDLSTIDENTFEQIVVAMKEAVLDPKGVKE